MKNYYFISPSLGNLKLVKTVVFWVVYLPLEQNSHQVCGVLMNPDVRAL